MLACRGQSVLVQDNLNTHSKASLYEAFPAAEARRLVERFEWRYTPKHGSWLNLANPNSASYRPNASIAASPINKSSLTRSPPGNMTEIKITPSQIGASQPPTPASNSTTPTRQSD